MDFLGDIGALLGNVATGGLFGLLGSIAGAVAKHFQEKQRQAWEREKWTHEETLLRLQMEKGRAETEQELALAAAQGSWSGLEASLRSDAATGQVHTWVNDVRSLFRPFLTLFLWILAAVVLWLVVDGLIAGYLRDGDVSELVRYTVFSIVFSASTATVWWFGDRAISPPGMKGR